MFAESQLIRQFPWDRYGEKNRNSSCWVRVSSTLAGKQLGAMHLPRIGEEVLVDFLGGDPELPFVRGRLFKRPEHATLEPARAAGPRQGHRRSMHRAMSLPNGLVQVDRPDLSICFESNQRPAKQSMTFHLTMQ
jgi:uncharacterized protein involved in type VI secretion and phage assembly